MTRPTIVIDDPADPRIADYVNIRERDLLRDQKTFICEGKTVLQVLVRQSRFPVKSLLVLQNRLAGLSETVQLLPPHIPVYVAQRAVMDAIAGFPMHRGVLAAAHKSQCVVSGLGNGPVIVASALANHDNVGALFRNAAAFGASALFLDEHCCDPLYRKAIRVSVGGVLKVPFHHGKPLRTIITELEANGFQLAALATNGPTILADWKPYDKTAILVGSEGDGLPSEILSKVTTLRIPMHGGFDSLNVSTAAAIALHHVAAGDAKR
ncbi:MAG: RNA methyltransferase [Pseudomonadota bacterium]